MGKTILIIKEEKMKRLKKVLALCLSAAILLTSIPFGTAMGAAREPEIVAGGYEIDMADLPKVHFAEHPEWEELYDAAWNPTRATSAKQEQSSTRGALLCGRSVQRYDLCVGYAADDDV